MGERVILHVDMDYFFAQVEELENPSLKDTPTAVCMVSDRLSSMGTVASANYVARKYGVKSGMPCFNAKKICPQITLLPARKRHYEQVSGRVMEILACHCKILEQVSVDEAYLNVSEKTGFDNVEKLIVQIKKDIFDGERLTCSIGAGPNKLIAKMGSSEKKPDGHTIVKPHEVEEFLASKPVEKLFGVGEKTAAKLKEMGVDTVSKMRALSRERLTTVFGEARGGRLYDFSRGIDDSAVRERQKEQYGRLKSLRKTTNDAGEVRLLLDELTDEVHQKLKSESMSCRTISATFILDDLTTMTRSKTLPTHTSDLAVMKETAHKLVDEFMSSNNAVRRAGITASNIRKETGQKSLFEF